MGTQTLPKLGEAYEGGKFAGITTGKDGAPYALILLDSEFAGITLNWRDAMTWAKDLGDDADLPTRVETAMLFANLPSQFSKDWYWTSEQHASYSDYAWFQVFSYGNQNNYDKGAELRARAVRRLPIQSLSI